jgi:maleate isomerase
LIIPSSNRMVEQEMIAAYPLGVIAHVTRLRMTGKHRGQSLASLAPRVTEAAGALADAKCEIVTFHCTANSMAEGPDGEALLLRAMAEAGAAHVSSTATAMRRALAALGAKRIVLVTPYSQPQTDHEAEFFAAIGIEVVRAVGHGLPDSDAYCATPAEVWRDKALAARHPDADAYFLSCANISTFSVIEPLEAALDRPVVSSNQVVVWDQLRQIGWSGLSRPPGRLFSMP